MSKKEFNERFSKFAEESWESNRTYKISLYGGPLGKYTKINWCPHKGKHYLFWRMWES
jgi:hypothetical protein